MGKTHKGLDRVEVPQNDGTIEVHTSKMTVQPTCMAYIEKHYQQANETPGGLHGPARNINNQTHPDNIIEQILNGEGAKWERISEESRQWFQELEKIMETTIATEIHVDDFIQHFKAN